MFFVGFVIITLSTTVIGGLMFSSVSSVSLEEEDESESLLLLLSLVTRGLSGSIHLRLIGSTFDVACFCKVILGRLGFGVDLTSEIGRGVVGSATTFFAGWF